MASNSPVLPGDLSYASIDTVLNAADDAYDVYSGAQMLTSSGATSTSYQELIDSGWTQITNLQEQVNSTVDYQGIAFYKVVNGVTEVIIANRGSTLNDHGYDWLVSDTDISRGASVPADAAAVAYYNAVTDWITANITGQVQIIETGHSLGGQEADFIEAERTAGTQGVDTTYATETVSFDAPGLPKGVAEPSANALNISLSTDPVHSLGGEFNAGYSGSSVVVNGGISAFEAFELGDALGGFLGGALGVLIGEGTNHMLSQIFSYLSVSPALGGVNIGEGEYQPGQITQGEVGQMAGLLASAYDSMTPTELANYYHIVLAGGSGGGTESPPANGTSYETFTDPGSGTSDTLTGSEGDVIVVSEGSESGDGTPSSVTETDNAGDQFSGTYSADGSYIASDTWSNAQGTEGSDTYKPDGSSSGKVVYASGGYATYFADGLGNVTWDYYNSQGDLFSWSWIHSDGSSESGTQVSNGLTLIPGSSSSFDVPTSYFEVAQNPDGSYVDYTGTIGNQESTSQFNAAGSPTSTSATQGPGKNYDLSDTMTQTSTDGSGNVVTDEFDSAGDLVSKSVQYASGASEEITYNASGATSEKDVNTDGSSDLILTDGGDQTKNTFNTSGVLSGDTWSLSDGTTGQDTFNADGSGSGTITYANGATSTLTVASSLDITITNDNASGQKVSEDWWQDNGTHGVTVYDPDGGYTTYNYEQNGNVVETEYAPDQSVALQETVPAGSLLSPDGSEFGSIANSDGSSSLDYVSSNGDAVVFNISASGQLSSVDHASAQPTSGFSITLSGGSTVQSPYDGNTAAFTGPDGTHYVEYMNSSGVATGEDWTSPGGSYGYVTFNADGSSTAITYNTDGTYFTTVTDTAGDTTTDYYDSTGSLTSDSWSDVSGPSGSDEYNPDGSSSGTEINADGSYSQYTNDGQGNITEWDYDSAGNPLSSEWQLSNGSYGNEVVNADGSMDGSQYQSDGSYETFTIDPQGDNLTEDYSNTGQLTGQSWSFSAGNGNTITYGFDPAGNLMEESWASADGATETVLGASGSNLLDVLSADRVDGEAISGTAAGGTMQALGNNDTVSAAGGQNVMYALGTGDYLQGANGRDTLIALGADATLAGGTGNEVFEVNDPTDVVQTQAGAASNEIYSSVSYTLPTNADVLTLTGTEGITATGNSDAANVITGNSGDDVLVAGSGSDTLISGTGIDTLFEGAGPDTLVVNNSSDIIITSAFGEQDTVESSVSYVLTAPISTLIITGSADLSAADGYGSAKITGNAGDDTLIGGSGSDTLVAGSGVDTLESGSGNNTFVVDNADDVIQLNGSYGRDTVESSVNYTLDQGLDTLDLTGAANLEGQGNTDSSNVLEANSGNDILIAGSGGDTLVGGSGEDTLVAGTGADRLEGGSGITTYLLNSGFGESEISPTSGNDVIEFGAGINPSNLTVSLASGTGGDPALLIQEGGSSVTVDGGVTGSINDFEFSGGTTLTLGELLNAATVTADTLVGANGNAILDSSDSASLSGSWNDTILGSGTADTLVGGAGDESLLATGDEASIIGGVGGDTLAGWGAHDTVEAGNGNQQLYGLGTGDILVGGIGDDTLYGGNSLDTMVAGTGNTIMNGSSVGDSIVLSAGATVTLNPSSTSGSELIELPAGMTLGDFTAYEGTNGSLILQSASNGTTLIINDYLSSASNGTLWMIADSSGEAEQLSAWVDSLKLQSNSSYAQEISNLRASFAANLGSTLNEVGQAGGDIAFPEPFYASGPGLDYQFNGVTTENVTVHGGTFTAGDSEDTELSYTTLPTGSTSELVGGPTYSEVTVPGWQEFIPDSSLTQTEIDNLENLPSENNGQGISIQQGTNSAGEAGYTITQLSYTQTEQTGTHTTTEIVPEYTTLENVTESLTTYNITGDGGNDVITSGPIEYNQYQEDVGPSFVGTVNTGNGNVAVDLGMNNWGYTNDLIWSSPGPLPLGAFVQAGSGNDSIAGTGGADVIAAGTGFDYIDANFGSTVYVPMEGASSEEIDIQGPFYGYSPLPSSTLVLPTGITPQDLTYRLFTGATSALDQDWNPMSTLQISYGDSSVLIDFTPTATGNYSGYLAGLPKDDINGIDTFQFADGTELTREQVLAMAGAAISASTLNPTVSSAGASLDANATVQGSTLFSGSDSSGLQITWYQVSDAGTNGGYFELNGVEQTPGKSFYVSVDQLPDLTYISGSAGSSDSISVSAFDGVVWGSTNSFSVSVQSSSLYEATAADQEVTGGSSGPDTLVGGYGGDTLVGSSGSDTFDYSVGGGAEEIQETATSSPSSDNLLQFGSGITASSLSLGATAGSDLVLSTGSGSDSVSIDGFNPLNPLQSFPLQSFAFSDGTDLTLLQLLSDGSVIGTSGSISNSDGTTTNYQFTPSSGQIYSAQESNAAGQWLETVSVNADGSYTTASYTYNADGSETETEVMTPAPGGGGLTTEVIDTDSQGQITKVDVANPDGSTDNSTYTYNADGSHIDTEVQTPAGGGAPTTIVYDVNSQWQTTGMDITNPDGSTSDRTYVYNPDGSQVEADVETPASGGGSTTTVYDTNSQGQQTAVNVTDPDGSTDDSSYVYNADGSVTQTEVVTPAGGGATTTAYQINSQNQWTSVDVTNPDGSTDDTTYTYNADGSQTHTQVQTPADGGTVTTIVANYTADDTLLGDNSYALSSNGSYTDNWNNDVNDSHGSYWWNASSSEYQETWYDSDGSSFTDQYQYASGGSPTTTGSSFLETYTGSDGSQGTREYDASTGAITVSWDSAATGQLNGTTTDSGFYGLENESELTNTQPDLAFFNPSVNPNFAAFLEAH